MSASIAGGAPGVRGVWIRLVSAGFLALAAAGLVPVPDAAAASGRCAPGKGVTVVVDYGPLGGGTVIGCDPKGGGKSAPQVVKAAGFSLSYVSSQPGFVCQVNGQPADSDCRNTPPPDAYWGLFWSDGDPATWTYSSEGVGSLDLSDGGSIGWRWQDGGARDNPGEPPTKAAAAPSPPPSSNPSPEPTKPPKAADPTPTPTPSASVPPGTVGSGKTPGEKADPGGPDEQPSAKNDGDKDRGKGDDKGGKEGDRNGKGGKYGKGGKDEKRPRDKANPQQVAEPSESPAVAALEPLSGEPSPANGSSTALTLVALGAVLLLAGAAGVIGWRRRV